MAIPGSLREDTPRDDVAGWDSMGALMLMAELDTRFDLVLTPEESREMRVVRDVLTFLEERGHLQP